MEKQLYSLTNPQKSIYLTEEYYSGTNINNIAGILKINDVVDFDKFILSIKQFVKQNDSCRILLDNKDEEVKQYICEYKDFPIEVINVKSESELFSTANEIAQKPFSLYNLPLFKFVVFRFPNNYGGFIVNMHHLIADSWTLGITVNEIMEIYSSYLQNKNYAEKDISLYSYANYISSEVEYKNSIKYEKDKAYWSEVFSTIPDNATIPSLNNSSENSTKASRKELPISLNLLDDIKNYCEKQKVSLFNFLTAIFSLYISRVSNLDDFCIGTPILNRSNFKEKNIAGMFINTLPLRVSVDNSLYFKDFLNLIMANSMALLRHQKYSYQNIIEDLRKKQSNLPNLYNIMISYQITKMNEEQDNVPHSSTWLFNGNIADDIDIHIFDFNDTNKLNIAYDYKCEKYSSYDIEQIHERILYVISQVLNDENLKLSDIEIVTLEEKEKLIHGFNQTKIDYPRNKTIVELFEEQVLKHSNDVALTFENESLTYKELNEKVNQLAHFLKNNYQISAGDVIGLFIDKSLEMIIAMYAILKAGGTFLPLDIELPTKRLKYILDNSNPKLILTTHIHSSSAKELSVPYLAIDLDSTFIYENAQAKENLPICTTPEDLIYIIYTSGSTGNPKGVMVKQRNIVRLVKNPNFLTFKEHEVMVQTGTIVFDACIFEIFGSLLNGFHLYVLKKDELLDLSYMKSFIKSKKVTILFLTTGLLNGLANEDASIFEPVRYLLTGGDVISPTHIKKIYELCPNIQIINCYGPTENGSYSTCYAVDKNNISTNIPIGKPISNSTCYIVSKTGSLQPIGIPGELWVGGDGIAKGYINRDDLTKEKFQKNPFGDGYIYKTGDLVKYLPDGNIVFLSRIDKQIKLRGFRIELEEIDNNILKFNGINESVSILADINGQKAICSYITSNSEISIKDLKAFLENILPDYMIPTYIMQIKSLPLTISGKIDRKALPIPTKNINKKIIPARNEIDNTLIQKISSLLSIENLSIEDSFFEIGGDSLSAISLVNTIHNIYNIPITVKDIFRYPTVIELSDYIASNVKSNFSNITISKAKDESYYPISSAQRRIYYTSSIDKNSILYNIAGGLEFASVPDITKLENCFKHLIKRHEALRTLFTIFDNDVYQIVKDDIDFSLKVKKQNGIPLQKLFEEFVKPFSLDNCPLFDACLVIQDDNKATLFLNMHHIICDGTSLSIFMKELSCLYNGEILPEKSIDYKDFAVWENNNKDSISYEESKNFWVSQFKEDIPVLSMPTNFERPQKQSYDGDNYLFEFSPSKSSKIIDFAKQNNITPYMLFLTCYYILLNKYTSQDDIVVGTPIAGRSLEELQSVFGMFVNSLPLKQKININSTVLDFINQTKNYCLEAFSHQDYPFNELVSSLDVKRDISRNPLFDTMFIYQNNGYEEVLFNGIKSTYYIPNLPISKFDFSLEVVPFENYFTFRIEYATKLFTKKYIERLAKHFELVLDQVLSNANETISNIKIISKEEEYEILHDFNDTKVDYPSNSNIVELWYKQVDLTPNETAIVFENESMTYAQLDEKSNQLAHFMQNNGVKAGDIVPILLDKSLEMIVSILGILKVGAAFLPIDVQYPKERIDYMLHDSNANILLTVPDFIHKSATTIKPLSIELSNYIYEREEKTRVNANINPDSLAYVMYTSGSTGNPKGVMVTHKNIVRLIKNNNFIEFKPKERILQTGSIVFDACTFEIWAALLNGFTLYIIKKQDLLDASKLQDYLLKNKITILWLTAPLMQQLSEDNPHMFRSVRVLLTGGDVLSPKHINMIKSANPNLTIINGYGPTENTTFSCCFTIDKLYDTSIPIGKPISNSTAYVVSSTGNLQPIGIPGELWVGGDGVGKGYLNNENLTKEKFIPNPFGSGMVYKTGDLVSWNEDGTICFIGRIDSQVKIRGFRVELSEINLGISKFPAIKECYTTVLNINNEKTICSYIATDNLIDENELKEFLKNFLPVYMIPSHFMQLEKLPINTNGKVDKNKLPINFNNALIHRESIIPPRNKTEEILLTLFKKVLNYDNIGITDNFFEIGGDSLSAMKLQVEALSNNLQISYGNIFDFPTVEKLSNYLLEKVNNSDLKNSNEQNLDINENEIFDKQLDKSDDEKYNEQLDKNKFKIFDNQLNKSEDENYNEQLDKNKFKIFDEQLNKSENEDYKKYDKFIANNYITNNMSLTFVPIKNVLLTGFTGFLGAHVLDSLLKNTSAKVYCLIRSKNNFTAEQRLKNVLKFYFENKYDNLIGKRIFLVEGDITDSKLGLNNENYENLGGCLDTVIHCAALVKHYGNYDDFNNININGTQNIISLCEKFNLRLLHVSTISVSGNNLAEGSNIENNFGKEINYNETKFYIGQNLSNAYVHSKFEAEHLVLEAISKGLNACILRMGNLTSRFSEGKFQQNHFENAFVNRIRSFLQIGYLPDYMMDLYAEFTPIDYCGDAIVKIASYFNKDYNVFHLLNEKHVNLDKLYEIMVELGIDIKLVSAEKFEKIINNLLQDQTKKNYLEGIINDFDKNKKLVYRSEVKIESDFTKEFLSKIGFEWPAIDKRYLKNYFKYLADIGYFNINIK